VDIFCEHFIRNVKAIIINPTWVQCLDQVVTSANNMSDKFMLHEFMSTICRMRMQRTPNTCCYLRFSWPSFLELIHVGPELLEKVLLQTRCSFCRQPTAMKHKKR